MCVCVCREGEDRLPLLSNPRVSLMTNGTLVMTEIEHLDAGVYSCSVKHNDNISIIAHLEVYSQSLTHTHTDEGGKVEESAQEGRCWLRPVKVPSRWCVFSDQTVILEPPQNRRVLQGTSTLLPCRFYTDPRLPPALVVWKRGKHKLMESKAANK